MNKKVLFLSHDPHAVHTAFARSVDAREYLTHMKKFVALTKKLPWSGHFYAPYSFIYSFFIKTNEDIILVDGGASIYIALGLKFRKPRIKIIHLDGDTMFYAVRNAKPYQRYLAAKILKKIDAVISVSKQNQEQITIDVPSVVCTPFPKNVTTTDTIRKPYGLYVGRLDPDKNIKQIIDFGLQCPSFEKFIVVGDGVLRSYVERLAQNNPKLQYDGFQTDVASYYNTCTFLIHTPDYDPHPTVTMEAALCGCFPIMSQLTGSNYLFDPILTVINPDDFETVNKKIIYLTKQQHEMRKLLLLNTKNIPSKKTSIDHFQKSFAHLANQIDS